MIALSALCRQNIVPQAQIIALPLPSKPKRVQRLSSPWREQLQRFACRLGFEKLPHRPHLHEFSRFLFDLFHALKQFNRLRVALMESFFEIAAESHVPPVEHEWIDVTPDIAQVRY